MGLRARIALLALAVLLTIASTAGARTANVAGLQVGLQARGVYPGTIDGVLGPRTRRAVRLFQRRAGIAVDGIPGPQTRSALGRYGCHRYASRMLDSGNRGWDVAALQFKLAWHGFPSGTFDGVFGPHTNAALLRFQRWAGLGADGVPGPATFRALSQRRARIPFGLRKAGERADRRLLGPARKPVSSGTRLPGVLRRDGAGREKRAASSVPGGTAAATASWSSSATIVMCARSTRTSPTSPCTGASASLRARRSTASAPLARRRGRICTSRFTAVGRL
jgi:peptidoglycan hydrolase-like protein with peptidoglycan-binding domain